MTADIPSLAAVAKSATTLEPPVPSSQPSIFQGEIARSLKEEAVMSHTQSDPLADRLWSYGGVISGAVVAGMLIGAQLNASTFGAALGAALGFLLVRFTK